ncbi:hypothetical protein LOD99_12310 [Oopsacas minuta]|uniref:TIR domain-containing protein n=1 Tax=Oopsacas minuta TaxID=111878 RepID=A0AAV7JEU5_9METZ|nr:hypothetical protein LOD99_12310 [Oopsacas minuta]
MISSIANPTFYQQSRQHTFTSVVQLRPEIIPTPGRTTPIPFPFPTHATPSFPPHHTNIPSYDLRNESNMNINPFHMQASQYNNPCIPMYHTNSPNISPVWDYPQHQTPPPVPPRLHRPIIKPPTIQQPYPQNGMYHNSPYLETMPPSRINIPPVPNLLTPSGDFAGFRETTIIGSPPRTAEHKFEDIPLWMNEQVVHLPPDVLTFICTRIDNMPATGTTRNWRDLAKRAGFPVQMSYANHHTSMLLEVWRPRLCILIEKLIEMDCKELVSEIIQMLKSIPPPNYPYQPNYTIQARNTVGSDMSTQHSKLLNNTVCSAAFSEVSKYSVLRSISPSPSTSTSYTRSPSPELPEVQPEIYVSFHKNDEEFGKEIIRQIELLNIPVTSNLALVPGTNELTEITDNIDNCKKVIGVISPDYLRDEMPLYEGMIGIKKSITGKKRTFIPFQVKPTEKLPGYFSSIKAIHWSDERKWIALKMSLTKK